MKAMNLRSISKYLMLALASAAASIIPLIAKDKKKVDPSQIYGKIQIVSSFPDYRVKAVRSQGDVDIKIVKSLPGQGEWQFVDSFPDYKIQMVEAFPDFTAEFSGGEIPSPR